MMNAIMNATAVAAEAGYTEFDAAAKVAECIVPKGPTGLDPAQTSFFQALNIATKINKGSIEIINDCKVLFEGVKVGTSEAALLTKMGIKDPAAYAAKCGARARGGGGG